MYTKTCHMYVLVDFELRASKITYFSRYVASSPQSGSASNVFLEAAIRFAIASRAMFDRDHSINVAKLVGEITDDKSICSAAGYLHWAVIKF